MKQLHNFFDKNNLDEDMKHKILFKTENKVLFVSYFFPPVGGVGVIRVMKFVKYLSRFGYTPRVLTVKKGFFPTEDESLLLEIPKEVAVDRVSYFEPGLWFNNYYWQFFIKGLYLLFLIPDYYILWFLPALIRGYKIIKKEKIKIIFTSSSACSDHLVALMLKKMTGVKWVADFRDEWSTNPSFRFLTPLHRFVSQILEKKVVRSADMVITVSSPLTNYFQTHSPYQNKLLRGRADGVFLPDKSNLGSVSNGLSSPQQATGYSTPENKFFTITNGFDREDFIGKNEIVNSHYCQIVYAGSLYAKRRASLFLEVLNELHLPSLKINFIGQKTRVSHRDAIKAMLRADILLLILSPQDGPGVFTGKIFEYLAARKPILALAPAHTEAAKLIKKLKVGEVADPLNKEEIKEKILKIYSDWEKGKLKIPKVDISQFDRLNLTARLAKLFDNLLNVPKVKIKICIIGNSPDSFHHQKFCQYLILLGYEVHFIALKPGTIDGVQMHYVVPLGNIFMPIWGIKTVVEVRKIIRQIKPDIVHGQYLTIGGILAYFSGFRPYVLTAWGSDILLYKQSNFAERILLKRVIKDSSFMTGDSPVLLDKAIELGAKPRKYLDFIFGIDVNNFKKRPSESLRQELKLTNQKVIFCPRSISPLYNIDVLIEAFSLVAKNNKQVKLALLEDVRDQIYFEKVKKMIRTLRLFNRVILLPRIDNIHISKYYNLAEVVVSVPSSDSCSVSFLEAMACQCKIVLSDLPYLKEWFSIDRESKHGNFWLTPIENKQELANNLQEALDFQSKTFKIIGENNRKLIQKKAEIKANFNKLDYAYKELIGDPSIRRKIKICLIGNLQSPQNQILVNYLKNKNYEVHFITYKKAEIKGIKIYLISQQELTSKSNSMTYVRGVFDRAIAVNKIKNLIIRIQPDILHGQSLTFSGIWAELSGFHPLVLTLWGSDVMLYKNQFLLVRYLIKKALKNADYITGASDALYEKAKEIGMKSNFAKIHFGIDLKVFKKIDTGKLKRRLNIKRERIIFCPRSIAPIYNIDTLIEAFKIIADKQDVKLILLGQNAHYEYLKKIKKMVDDLNLVDKVLFLPRIENKEMVGYYNVADVVVSLASSDGCAMSFLEAMACEAKIVISNVTFISEWFIKGKRKNQGNFWIVPIRNTQTTALAIEKSLSTTNRYFRKIGQMNRQLVTDHAELKSNFDKLDMLYKKLYEQFKNK